MTNNYYRESSISFTGLLTILFIALKLCHVIDWSWLWVLSPIWIPATIFLVGILLFIIIYIIVVFIKN